MDRAQATSAACTSIAASCTEKASTACIGSVPLTRDRPSLGASCSGSRPCAARTSAAGRPSGGPPGSRSSPSPISGCARCASWARSPDAPTEPLPGMTGSRPWARSSSRRRGRSARTPEYPAVSVLARSMSSARTTSSPRGAPVPAACDRMIAACSAVRSASPTGVSASAPNPVLTPYTGALPLSARVTTDRLCSIRAGAAGPSCAVASPCATATTSSMVRALPSMITSRMLTACHVGVRPGEPGMIRTDVLRRAPRPAGSRSPRSGSFPAER